MTEIVEKSIAAVIVIALVSGFIVMMSSTIQTMDKRALDTHRNLMNVCGDVDLEVYEACKTRSYDKLKYGE